MRADRLKRVYKKTILEAACPHYIQSLRKEETQERKMRALADSLETSDDSNDSAKTLANYLSNDSEEFQQFLGRPL